MKRSHWIDCSKVAKIIGVAFALVIWFVSRQAAAQGNQTISLNTGLAGQTGTMLIPLYQTDDDWYVTSDPLVTSPLPRRAWVVDPVTSHMKWALTLPNSRWISGAGNKYMGMLPKPPTHFTYRICFTLPALFSPPYITYQMRADDVIREVRLNGSVILFSNPNPSALASAATPGSFLGPPIALGPYQNVAFHAGQNCLEVGVDDKQQMVSGLNVAGMVTYQAPPSPVCLHSGQVINWDLSTGTDFVGNKQPIGFTDWKWKLVAVPTGSPGPAFNIGTVPGWLPNAPQPANWINRINTLNWQWDSPGVYKYKLLLPSSLNTGVYSSIQIIMRYAADNSAIVRLNGTQVDSCGGPSCYSAWRPTLTLTPTVLSDLEVEVTNITNLPSATGLIVDAKLCLTCK